jgi:hypothetical protein
LRQLTCSRSGNARIFSMIPRSRCSAPSFSKSISRDRRNLRSNGFSAIGTTRSSCIYPLQQARQHHHHHHHYYTFTYQDYYSQSLRLFKITLAFQATLQS